MSVSATLPSPVLSAWWMRAFSSPVTVEIGSIRSQVASARPRISSRGTRGLGGTARLPRGLRGTG